MFQRPNRRKEITLSFQTMKDPLPYPQLQVSAPHPSESTTDVRGTRPLSHVLCSAADRTSLKPHRVTFRCASVPP